jgi:thiamine kinase-like enzyme
MDDIYLEQILPLLPGYSRSAEVDIVRLYGGITNTTYRVSLNEASYVVSIDSPATRHLGIDRKAEHQNMRVAHEYGIAPAVVFAKGNLFVQPFVKGRLLRAGDLTHKPTLLQVVNLLQRCHRIPLARVQGRFCVFDNVKHLIREGSRLGTPLPANTAFMLEQNARIRHALSRQPIQPVFCHNDLVPENVICAPEGMVLIDWEYAGVGDRYFDLGMLAAYHQLDDKGERDLLEAYSGKVTDGSLARLRLMRMMSDLRDGAWSLVQLAVSSPDFDLAAYGADRFGRFTRLCEQPAFEDGLHTAAVNAPLDDVMKGKGNT